MNRYIATATCVMIFIGALAGMAYGVDGEASGQLNVNTASSRELAWFLLRNGVGSPVRRAENIIAYRQENGPFREVEEIGKVEGISEFELDRIRRWVKVAGQTDYKPAKEGVRPMYPYPSPTYPKDGPSRGNFPHDEPYGPWRSRP